MDRNQNGYFRQRKKSHCLFYNFAKGKEPQALEFAKRRQRDFRQFVMSKKSFGFTPKIDFAIDEGEHNRQRIDELSNQG